MNIIIDNCERTNPNGFVIAVYWRVEKTQAHYTAMQYGTELFEKKEGDFTPFENLTESVIQDWLKERWGVDGIAEKEAKLNAELETVFTPPVIEPPYLSGLPWDSSQVTTDNSTGN